MKANRRQARWVRWDNEKLRLIIEKWEKSTPQLSLKIVPLSHP